MKSTVLQRWFLGYFLGIRRFHMIFKGVSKWDRHKLVNDWRGSGHLDHSVVTGSRYWTATTTLHPRHVGLSENAGNSPNIYIYIILYIYMYSIHCLVRIVPITIAIWVDMQIYLKLLCLPLSLPRDLGQLCPQAFAHGHQGGYLSPPEFRWPIPPEKTNARHSWLEPISKWDQTELLKIPLTLIRWYSKNYVRSTRRKIL